MNISKILIALCLMISAVCFGQNETEPNNTFGQANVRTLVNLTDIVKGSICPTGDLLSTKFAFNNKDPSILESKMPIKHGFTDVLWAFYIDFT